MSRYCFGVDLGGTTVKIGLFDTEGTVLEKWEIPTRTEDNGSKILPDIAEAVLHKTEEKKIAKEDVIGVGIGVPGPVDDDGVVHKAVNLGWGVMNINEILGGLLQMPVKAGNDANVAALGEMWCGGGKGCRNMVLATLGTGVGGGIIINGKMVCCGHTQTLPGYFHHLSQSLQAQKEDSVNVPCASCFGCKSLSH